MPRRIYLGDYVHGQGCPLVWIKPWPCAPAAPCLPGYRGAGGCGVGLLTLAMGDTDTVYGGGMTQTESKGKRNGGNKYVWIWESPAGLVAIGGRVRIAAIITEAFKDAVLIEADRECEYWQLVPGDEKSRILIGRYPLN